MADGIVSWKKRLVKQSDLTDLHEKLKEKGKKIVFTAGGWDMLHVGQGRYLEEARARGDILVVGVSSNAAIRAVKGKGRPILDEKVRAEMLTYLRCVDLVTIIPDSSCQPILALLKPDVYITVGEDWNENYKDSKEYKTVTKYGGEVIVVTRQSPYISTTKILQRAVGVQLGDVFKEYMKLKDDPLKERN
jgi:rfaE bifunctional protein nucleotidyltransferase chain/domain